MRPSAILRAARQAINILRQYALAAVGLSCRRLLAHAQRAAINHDMVRLRNAKKLL